MKAKKAGFIKRERPHLCPDRTCKLVWTNYEKKYFEEGGSFICYGLLKKPHKFTERKTEHINNIGHCEYTPLKGIIHFFSTFEDLWSETLGIFAVMDKLKPLHCSVCKRTVHRQMASVIVTKDKKPKCWRCYFK